EKNKSLSFSEFDLKLSYPIKFVETLGVAGLDDDLKLKEFSNSLTKKVYTWERVLDNQDSHDEKGLVKVCIQGMFDEYMVHLKKYSYSECNSER
ncbi:hypothetical protein Gogos_004612, partial [Gossypium gossypioides]|nr:hypothetical protein [Gossypium gossypioides]